MVSFPAMPNSPVAVIDVLNSLLESQQNSIIRFMGEGSPYLGRATADVRRPLAEMLRNNLRRCRDLFEMIESLGGTPVPAGLQPEEQYLSYLSLKFLLPKLVYAKQLIVERYRNALRALAKAPPEVLSLLQGHVAAHEAELATLKQVTGDLLAAK